EFGSGSLAPPRIAECGFIASIGRVAFHGCQFDDENFSLTNPVSPETGLVVSPGPGSGEVNPASRGNMRLRQEHRQSEARPADCFRPVAAVPGCIRPRSAPSKLGYTRVTVVIAGLRSGGCGVHLLAAVTMR